jgi:hypothetical protein
MTTVATKLPGLDVPGFVADLLRKIAGRPK